MKLVLAVVLVLLAVMSLMGCGRQSAKQSKQRDRIDQDFRATIRQTERPYVFEVKVEKVNSGADKLIGRLPVIVDLTLKNSSGRVYTGERGESRETPVYAEEVDYVFEALRKSGTDAVTGEVRLLKNRLPPGSYEVQPRVRIYLEGKDAPAGFGTVAVPAANSVQVVIR